MIYFVVVLVVGEALARGDRGNAATCGGPNTTRRPSCTTSTASPTKAS